MIHAVIVAELSGYDQTGSRPVPPTMRPMRTEWPTVLEMARHGTTSRLPHV